MNFKKIYQIIIIVLCFIYSFTLAEPSLTIYNENFAIVREQLNLNLNEGDNKVSITDITTMLESDSVILRDPSGKQKLQILEQNYRADPLSQELLLSLNEGKVIDFIVKDNDNVEKTVKGKIIRSGYVSQFNSGFVSSNGYVTRINTQPIIEVDGKLRFSIPGEPVFPSLPDDTLLKPTINWLINTDKSGPLDAELSYITSGMSWKADYSMLMKENNNSIQVIGWVTFMNQSGKTFENARIKLMAGDVSKIQQTSRTAAYSGGMMGGRGGSVSVPPPVTEISFDDYHLYTLNRQTTLHDRQTKQVEFLNADNVRSKTLYIYDGAVIDRLYSSNNFESIRRNRDYGTQSNAKVWIYKEFMNTSENNLGIPLPKGKMRFYRQNNDDQLEFIGENNIDHTPADEAVRVYTGNAFDIVGERTRIEYEYDERINKSLSESFNITIRNHKERGNIEVRVVEHMYRGINWEVVEKSDSFTKTDSQTIEFRVMLRPGNEKNITYKVNYTW